MAILYTSPSAAPLPGLAQALGAQLQQSRTTSAGLWRFAREYAEAASIVANEAGDRFSHPAYFLHGRAIELALKAFLLARGTPYNTLRFKPFGHDLVSLAKEARRRKLGHYRKITTREMRGLELLNVEYSSKKLEYIVTGAFSIPDMTGLHFFTVNLVTSLEKFCINATYPGLRT